MHDVGRRARTRRVGRIREAVAVDQPQAGCIGARVPSRSAWPPGASVQPTISSRATAARSISAAPAGKVAGSAREIQPLEPHHRRLRSSHRAAFTGRKASGCASSTIGRWPSAARIVSDCASRSDTAAIDRRCPARRRYRCDAPGCRGSRSTTGCVAMSRSASCDPAAKCHPAARSTWRSVDAASAGASARIDRMRADRPGRAVGEAREDARHECRPGIDQRVALRERCRPRTARGRCRDRSRSRRRAAAAAGRSSQAQRLSPRNDPRRGRRSTRLLATAAGTDAGPTSREIEAGRRRRRVVEEIDRARRLRDGPPRCRCVSRASSIGPGTASASVSGDTTPPETPALQKAGTAGVEQTAPAYRADADRSAPRNAQVPAGCTPRSVAPLASGWIRRRR